MWVLPILAALGASLGWASGIVLAEKPAKKLGAFEFTRVQLLACSAIVAAVVTVLGYWSSVDWGQWLFFVSSICFGIILGNLAMIECLRRGGPRRTELLLSLKAPLVGLMAFIWLNEVPSGLDLLGSAIALFGVFLAVQFGGNERSKSDEMTGSAATVILLGISATAFQGFGFLAMKPAMTAGLEPLAATAIRLVGAAFLISVIALWPSGAFKAKNEVTPTLLGQTILPGFIGYVVSSSMLLYAFANLDAGIATVLGSLSPVLIVPILWLKEKVPPHPLGMLGTAMAVAGTAVIVLG